MIKLGTGIGYNFNSLTDDEIKRKYEKSASEHGNFHIDLGLV